MRFQRYFVLPILIFVFGLGAGFSQVKIVQLSDLHLGLARAPRAADNLRRAVDMANDRHPDAVVVTGDIGENPAAWEEARHILGKVKAPLYYVPGNHDVHTNDVDRYRRVFGDDFYRVQIRNVVLYAFDSELLGDFDNYDAKSPQAMQPKGEARDNGERMLRWMNDEARGNGDREGKDTAKDKREHGKGKNDRGDDAGGTVVIGMQHVPIARDGNMPPDSRPYWALNEPYRSRELDLLKRLGIRHMLVGHWHRSDVFEYGGITWHAGPATSWLPWGGQLGFAVHTIFPNGEMKTEFVNLD